jgi:hypothetical protein
MMCPHIFNLRRRRIGRIDLCAETALPVFDEGAEAAPADAGKTAVRILRFDAAAASADALEKRRADFLGCFFLNCRTNW